MESKSPPKPKRTLTDEQLSNKRRIDKLKHRENRAENKTRLENIERGISLLRHTIDDLVVHFRQLTTSDAARHQNHHHHHHQPPSASHDSTQHPLHGLAGQLLRPPSAPKSELWSSSSDPTTPLNSAAVPATTALQVTVAASTAGDQAPPFYDHLTERLYAQQVIPQQPLEAQIDIEALLAEIRGESLVVECRCGKQHSVDAQCTERIAVTMAVELGSMASGRGMTAPRTPALTDVLLHHTDASPPLAVILSSILRQYDFTHVNALCGWRFYPSSESRADLPAIMRPTQAQITIPHPKCLDFIPFPALRNYLCLNQHKDAQHSVDLCLRSMWLVLPPGKTLMTKTERDGVELDPEFEIFASDLRNWSMGSPWRDKFPQLRQFLF
ncbi:hypothetical protein CRV24_008545 [Beauveria bassiana]|nr:hypothetical protein CRV24_008545 [Beauveria bassiana]KAH8716627.1 hypothetical protein HC256_005388 [Beauveria bassiana]